MNLLKILDSDFDNLYPYKPDTVYLVENMDQQHMLRMFVSNNDGSSGRFGFDDWSSEFFAAKVYEEMSRKTLNSASAINQTVITNPQYYYHVEGLNSTNPTLILEGHQTKIEGSQTLAESGIQAKTFTLELTYYSTNQPLTIRDAHGGAIFYEQGKTSIPLPANENEIVILTITNKATPDFNISTVAPFAYNWMVRSEVFVKSV